MADTPIFVNRTQAGEKLAQLIQAHLQRQSLEGLKPTPIIYALPRGGLPVAAPIANLLGCPLTVVVGKKISHQSNPELAIGAATASGQVIWSEQKLFRFRLDHKLRITAMEAAINKAKSLEAQFLPLCPSINPKGATLILVDDGIATGMTMLVAVKELSLLEPKQIWLCTPLAPPKILPWLQQWCDSTLGHMNISYQIIVFATPEPFISVSNFYIDFPQVNMSEALNYLNPLPPTSQ